MDQEFLFRWATPERRNIGHGGCEGWDIWSQVLGVVDGHGIKRRHEATSQVKITEIHQNRKVPKIDPNPTLSSPGGNLTLRTRLGLQLDL